jgi:hypothetical protein
MNKYFYTKNASSQVISFFSFPDKKWIGRVSYISQKVWGWKINYKGSGHRLLKQEAIKDCIAYLNHIGYKELPNELKNLI